MSSPNPPAGSISGELGVVSLFDLGQLLLLNGATGCLVVHSNERRGFLYFVEGRLVNAVDDAYQQGENVACQIFSWKSGAFQFRPEPASGAATITSGTEAVMLEAARRMDEAGLAGQGTKESVRLTERQAQLNALRDVFKQVTSDASAVTAAAAAAAVPAPSVHLYALEQPGDRLVYRSGHPPRLRHKGVWSEAGEPPMSAAAFGTLRAWLLEACHPTAEETPRRSARTAEGGDTDPLADALVEPPRRGVNPVRRALELADGRVIGLDLVNRGADETIILRPVGLPAPDPSRLRGNLDRLEMVLGLSHGVILVGGPDLDSARQMLNMVVAVQLESSPESVLLASSEWTYEHREPRGVLLKTVPERLRRALRMLQPDICVLDPGLGRGVISLEELELVPRVIPGVVVSDPAAMLPRWLARVGNGDLDRAEVSLATTPLGLVMAYPDNLGDDTLAFNAWLLTERERVLALRGETATLSPILRQSTARGRTTARRRAA